MLYIKLHEGFEIDIMCISRIGLFCFKCSFLCFADEIMDKIKEAGFHIAARKETELTKEMAEEFYKEHKDKEYFSDLTEHMCR